jgi:hypothetical protein
MSNPSNLWQQDLSSKTEGDFLGMLKTSLELCEHSSPAQQLKHCSPFLTNFKILVLAKTGRQFATSEGFDWC